MSWLSLSSADARVNVPASPDDAASRALPRGGLAFPGNAADRTRVRTTLQSEPGKGCLRVQLSGTPLLFPQDFQSPRMSLRSHTVSKHGQLQETNSSGNSRGFWGSTLGSYRFGRLAGKLEGLTG